MICLLTGAAYNVIAPHWPTIYAAALRLLVWLAPADQTAAPAAFKTGLSLDPAYGPAGTLPLG